MLKKLVKHGNSSALILDRSILALLNIDESAVLKLRIEGDTLLVKASETVKPTDSMMLEVEALHANIRSSASSNAICEANEERLREYCKQAETNPEKIEILKEWEPGTENAGKLQEAFEKIMVNYQSEIAVLGSESFQNDIETLTKQFQGDTSSKEFHDEILTIRLKHAPKLAEMDKEMREAAAALGAPDSMV